MSPASLPLLCLTLLAVSAQKAPRFRACPRDQPAAKLNECVRESLQRAVPELVKGLPDFGLLTIDPLHVDSLSVAKDEKSKGAVSVDIAFKNLDIIGLGQAKIKSANMDVNKMRLSSHIEFAGNVMLQGEYSIKGKVLVLPIEGKGRCNITLVNPKADLQEVQAKPLTRAGKPYAKITSFKFVVSGVDRVYYDLDNLFNGNRQLGDNMNAVLNDNWREVFDDVIGPVQTAVGVAFRHILDSVINKVPYNKIFP